MAPNPWYLPPQRSSSSRPMPLAPKYQWGKSERRKAKNPPGRVFPNSCWKGFSGGPRSQRTLTHGGLQCNHLRR